MLRIMISVAVFATLLLCAACGSYGEIRLETVPGLEDDGNPVVEDSGDAEMPSLPAGKEASATTGPEILGSSAIMMSGSYSIGSNSISLMSAEESTSWAMWEIVPGNAELQKVEIEVFDATGSEVYFAISDYSTGRWQMHGPVENGDQFELDNEINLSSGGNCYVSMITSGGSSATMGSLFISSIESQGFSKSWKFAQLTDNEWNYKLPSLVNLNGYPALAVVADEKYIYFMRSNNPLGIDAGDWDIAVVHPNYPAEEGKQHHFTGPSLAVVNDHPAMSYCDLHNRRINYIRSITSTGTETLDWTNNVKFNNIFGGTDAATSGWQSSLAVINGNPAVSFKGYLQMCYARSSTITGESAQDWDAAIVDLTLNAGNYNSLAEINGRPAIAYSVDGSIDDGFDTALKYAIANNPTGTGNSIYVYNDWHKATVLDFAPSIKVGKYASLAEVAGKPIIGFTNQHSGYSSVVSSMSNSIAGNIDKHWETLDFAEHNLNNILGFSSMAVVDGTPYMAYVNHNDKKLMVNRATAVNDSNVEYGSSVELDDNVRAQFTSMADINGNPAVCYINNDGQLMYAIFN